mmetsp:Transcript_1320/g.5653  ORF Transcript_1320/g.5653 Transcript_1320/m.5653 type:complete len:439 (-) Transcript_1320:11184-12500(-)|eukprot:scaffold1115_cov162-Pinguiococcus_pyrenoidosus.AAC.5
MERTDPTRTTEHAEESDGPSLPVSGEPGDPPERTTRETCEDSESGVASERHLETGSMTFDDFTYANEICQRLLSVEDRQAIVEDCGGDEDARQIVAVGPGAFERHISDNFVTAAEVLGPFVDQPELTSTHVYVATVLANFVYDKKVFKKVQVLKAIRRLRQWHETSVDKPCSSEEILIAYLRELLCIKQRHMRFRSRLSRFLHFVSPFITFSPSNFLQHLLGATADAAERKSNGLIDGEKKLESVRDYITFVAEQEGKILLPQGKLPASDIDRFLRDGTERRLRKGAFEADRIMNYCLAVGSSGTGDFEFHGFGWFPHVIFSRYIYQSDRQEGKWRRLSSEGRRSLDIQESQTHLVSKDIHKRTEVLHLGYASIRDVRQFLTTQTNQTFKPSVEVDERPQGGYLRPPTVFWTLEERSILPSETSHAVSDEDICLHVML